MQDLQVLVLYKIIFVVHVYIKLEHKSVFKPSEKVYVKTGIKNFWLIVERSFTNKHAQELARL